MVDCCLRDAGYLIPKNQYRSAEVPLEDIMLLDALQAAAGEGKRYSLSGEQRARVRRAQMNTVHIYFILAEGVDMVKIGKSRKPLSRMKEMQVGCPVPLRLLLTVRANHSTERHLHAILAEHHSHGEWFRLSEQVLSLIELAADHGAVGLFRLIDSFQRSTAKPVDETIFVA